MAKEKSTHYVNNKEFSNAVVEYVKVVNAAKEVNAQIPKVTDYIARCFLKIAEGLSHKSNFIRYTYREEMVMDAVENCLRAISNYNINTATRTGTPNAFSYFTQICFFAFLRRLAKEKKQQNIKLKFIAQSGIEDFMLMEHGDELAGGISNSSNNDFVDGLRNRIEKVHIVDKKMKVFKKKIREEESEEESEEYYITDNFNLDASLDEDGDA